jgi:hypothetical protein
VDRYLLAVDAWEAEYQQYYRMPGSAHQMTQEQAKLQENYTAARAELERYVPRARRLCLKYGVRDQWTTLLRIQLGAYAPQQRTTSAIGRNERAAITESLAHLRDAALSTERGEQPASWCDDDESGSRGSSRSLLGRIRDFFF